MVFVKTGNAPLLINQIQSGWKFPRPKDPQKVLRSYFPNADSVAYDVYLQFPMQSAVFLKQVDPNEIEMDCFRTDTRDLAADLSRALDLLGNMPNNTVSGLNIKPEYSSKWQLAQQAFIQGGAYLTLVPVATTAILAYSEPAIPPWLSALVGVVIAVAIYIPIYVYLSSKQATAT